MHLLNQIPCRCSTAQDFIPLVQRTTLPARRPDLKRLSEDELLDLRFCDLGVTIQDGELPARIDRLNEDLCGRGLRFRPHCWLSTEWFSPDGIPGIAIPFYLAHPRLMRLERKQLLEVEGGPAAQCIKILRHEAGHAIDTAYRLRRKTAYRKLFGKCTAPYPEYYLPRPASRKYVQHLDLWYAQSHPLEDFAETFAVWLRPGSRWRSRYKGWPALKKLHLVDELMKQVQDVSPPVRSRSTAEPISKLKTTLRQHYLRKREHYGFDYPSVFDNDLRKLFPGDPSDRSVPTAAAFLSKIRREMRVSVAKWTGEYSYTIDQVIAEMIQQSRKLKLRVGNSEDEARRDAMLLVAIRTTSFIHEGRHRIAM